MTHVPLVPLLLAVILAACASPPPANVARQPDVPTGFRAPGAVLILRAEALATDPTIALPALERLGKESLDRVTVELLMALCRGSDSERRTAAGTALVTIGERAMVAGYREFAGSIGESLYLSSIAAPVRERAYLLFMLLSNERALRHRDLPPPGAPTGIARPR